MSEEDPRRRERNLRAERLTSCCLVAQAAWRSFRTAVKRRASGAERARGVKEGVVSRPLLAVGAAAAAGLPLFRLHGLLDQRAFLTGRAESALMRPILQSIVTLLRQLPRSGLRRRERRMRDVLQPSWRDLALETLDGPLNKRASAEHQQVRHYRYRWHYRCPRPGTTLHSRGTSPRTWRIGSAQTGQQQRADLVYPPGCRDAWRLCLGND